MDEAPRESPLKLCTACGWKHDAPLQMCTKCGAPLSAHAFADPVGGLLTRGFALEKATTEPKKLIVIVGTWIWMIPMFFAGLFFSSLGIWGLANNTRTFDIGVALALALFGGGAIWISVTILWKTTSRFLDQRKAQRSHENGSSEVTDEDVETMTCLACGEAISPDDQNCPACGWSYSEGE